MMREKRGREKEVHGTYPIDEVPPLDFFVDVARNDRVHNEVNGHHDDGVRLQEGPDLLLHAHLLHRLVHERRGSRAALRVVRGVFNHIRLRLLQHRLAL